MNVPQWLHELGLERYVQAFVHHDVDGRALPRLTESDLAAIGVTSVGHRRKLMDAIATLGQGSVAPDAPAPAAGTSSPCAEHRQLSVLCCDLVDSTALSRRLDPEDLREVIGASHAAFKRIVAEYDGHVANFIGDGVLVYFGWPRAHEDDAERAVRAGLSMVQAAGGLKTPAGGMLAARAGVATGAVLVGDLFHEGPAQGQSAIGAAPGLSDLLHTLAAPGQVVIDELTRSLLGANFALQPLLPQALKRLPQPVLACGVSGERAVDSRFDARKGHELPPMIGRDHELALLQGRWAQAQDGEGQVVLLVGDAGIGKSRLSRALLDEGVAQPHERIRWQCSPYHTGSALWPVIQRLRHSARLLADDATDTALDKLEALLGRNREAMALYAALLGLDGSRRYGPLTITPQTLRERTLDLLVAHLFEFAEQRALLLVVEDAHWIDPTTLEFLKRALERIDGTRVLILVTGRPEKQPELPEHPSLTRLSLNRLNRTSVETIVGRLAGNGLQAQTRATIVAQSDGVPLFAEELTKAVLETGEAAIPASLHGSLMARLDQIPEAKEVAQIAACIGREFDQSLVHSVAARPDSVAPALDGLAAVELVFRRGGKSNPHFTFKHALVQEAAYESLLRSKRKSLHGRILEVLEAQRADTPPEMLAHHAAGADLTDKAIGYWRRAGDAAMGKSAYEEAAGHFDRAIRQINGQNHGEGHRSLQLELQLGLAYAHTAAHGYAADVVRTAFERAEHLLDDDPLKRLQVHRGLWAWHLTRGRLGDAQLHTFRLLSDATAIGRDEENLLANWAVGVSNLLIGELDKARHYLEKALALHDPAKPWHPLTTTYTTDPRAEAHGFLGWTLCIQGFADQGKDMLERARGLARDLPQVSARAHLHWIRALCGAFARDVAAVRADAQALAELASKHRLAVFANYAAKLLAWVAMESGRPADEAVAAYEAGSAQPAAGASRVSLLFFLGGRARALAGAGRHEEAIRTIEQAIHESDQMAQGWCDAELWRVRGELLLGSPRPDPAQALGCFERALGIARRRGAKLWELRAAVSLARLWMNQGESAKALNLLSPVYDWFTEGIDTPDLVDARTLLKLLGQLPLRTG